MENNIEFNGKIVKFPKNTKAFKALEFLESIKINPNKIWYLLIEDQGTDLKMVKYNRANDVNLIQYTTQLKEYYKSIYKDNTALLEQLEAIEVIGEKDFSVIKNIPLIIIEETQQTLISKITTDLINLLAD